MRTIVVDDQDLSLEILMLQLNSLEYFEDIQAFTDPEKAAVYAKDHPVDITFLDIVMDKIDGITLAGAICVLLKVHTSGYLAKPVTKEIIREQLEAILAHQIRTALEIKKSLRVQCFGSSSAAFRGEL